MKKVRILIGFLAILFFLMPLTGCGSFRRDFSIMREDLGMQEKHRIDYHIFDTGRPGPNVVVIGGVHGNEIAGWGAALYIVENIENFGLNYGRLLVMPKANRLSVTVNDRWPGRLLPGHEPESVSYRGEAATTDAASATSNANYLNLNRVFPGDINSVSLTRRIAALITEVLDDFEPDLIIDLHEATMTHAHGSLGHTLITPEWNYLAAQQAVDELNASGLTPELDFIPLVSSGDSGLTTTAFTERFNIPVFITETTRYERLAPNPNRPIISLERRVQQQVFLVRSLMAIYGSM